MNQATVALLGAIAGFTIFLGLPIARVRGVSSRTQGFLNAVATGVLVFLLVEILGHASEEVEEAVAGIAKGELVEAVVLATAYAVGVAGGLIGLVWFNQALGRRLTGAQALRGPGAAVAAAASALTSARGLSLMIATGLGLHNFSEGLAIGQAAGTGAMVLTGVLVIGFAVHNVTEGFGIAAPMASDQVRPSWAFLSLTGVIAGLPTFLGSVVGFNVSAGWAFVLFLALAAGALIYVINEMFSVSRRLNTPLALATGIAIGVLLTFGTELFLELASHA